MRALPDPAHRRRLSPVERVWLTARRIAPPFANQAVFEAPGGDLDAVDWGAALAEVARTTPGTSVVARGALGWTSWVDGVPPRLRRVDGSAWSGRDGGGAPFLAAPLDPRAGPTVELLLVDGPTPRLVLRSLHAALDGRGTLFLAERLFAAARGEALDLLPSSSLNDEQLARELGAVPEPPVAVDCPAPLGEVRPAVLATRWVRRDVVVASGRSLLPRVAVSLARTVPSGVRSAVRVDVPVDLRRHRPELRTPANLTGLVRVPVGALLEATEPVAAVGEHLRQALDGGGELGFCASLGSVRWLPLNLMEWGGRRAANQALATQRFSTSATISNLGRLDLGALSAPGFDCRAAFFIPPGSPSLPLFVTLCGGGEALTVAAAAPLGLADNGRLEALVDGLCEELRGQ